MNWAESSCARNAGRRLAARGRVIRRAGSHTGALRDESANRIYRAILREAREIELELAQAGLRCVTIR